MTIDNKLIDDLLKDYKNPEDIIGENGLLRQITKALVERAMEAEMTEHLGYEKHDSSGDKTGNSRNGSSNKTIKGEFGRLPIKVPRDRNSNFEPRIIQKGQTRFTGFDDKILSMYARWMTVREIQGHLEEIYQVEVSPSLISSITDGVIEEVRAWQNRPLEEVYPVIYLDALQLKIRDSGQVRNKAVYLAIGINMAGRKEVLGMWIGQQEGAKFWLQIVTELNNRGVKDIFIACVDGLKGFPEAIESVFPKAQVQLCIVHLVRHSLNYVGWKQRKEVAADLRHIYQAPTEDQAYRQLELFGAKWDEKYPTISRAWQRNWARITPFFAHPDEVRKVIYTTNAIESLNMTLRKVTKTRASFPNDEAALKLLYMALENISKKWTMPIANWTAALSRFAIAYEGRLPVSYL